MSFKGTIYVTAEDANAYPQPDTSIAFTQVLSVDLSNNGAFAINRRYLARYNQTAGVERNRSVTGGDMFLVMIDTDVPNKFRGAIVVHSAPILPLPAYLSPGQSVNFFGAHGRLSGTTRINFDFRSMEIELRVEPEDMRTYVIARFFGYQRDDLTTVTYSMIGDMLGANKYKVPRANLWLGHGPANPYYAAAAYIALVQTKYEDYGIGVSASTPMPPKISAASLQPRRIRGGYIPSYTPGLPVSFEGLNKAAQEPVKGYKSFLEYLAEATPVLRTIEPDVEVSGEDHDETPVLRVVPTSDFEYTFLESGEKKTIKLPENFQYVGEFDGVIVVSHFGEIHLLINVADFTKTLDGDMLRVLEDQSRRLGTLSHAYRLLLPKSSE